MPGSGNSASWYALLSGQSPELLGSIRGLLTAFRSLVIEDPLLKLVAARAAQLNHCAPSLAAHIELARRQGEHPTRLCHLSAWRDSCLFGPRERAALEWAEIFASSPDPADMDAVDGAAIGLSATDVSTLGFVVAVVNLCGRMQPSDVVAEPFGTSLGSDPIPSDGTTDPYVR